MSSPELLLAIDQGTQSVRAMLFDLNGQLIAKSQQHIEPYFSEQPNWAEQHASYFWDNLVKACQSLWRAHPELKSRVVGASLTCQRATMICLDKDLQPLRPATIWLDSRRTDKFPPLPLWFKAAIKAVQQDDIILQFQSKAECNWLAVDHPDIWAKTAHFVQLSGYLTLKLTDRLSDAVASQIGYIPFDYKKQKWASPMDFKWRALTLKPAQLPPLVQSSEPLGKISAQAALETGIPEGVVLYASGADKACEVLAAGAITPEVGCLSYGTTATFNTGNSKYVEPLPFLPAYPAAVPHAYNSEFMVFRGYWMVNWFKREFAAQEVLAARDQGIEPELLFDDLLRQSPPGAMGLMLQPFWTPGTKFPGPEAKGSIIGFGDVHTRAHMYRAIIEGIGYALRQGKSTLEKRNGVAITRLKVAGGGSQSDEVMQITANIFGLPAERPHTFETSGLGAAINAAVGAGYYKDHAAAVKAMSHQGKVFYPQAEYVALYDQLYNEVYRKIYPSLQPLYKAIRKITGYPK